MDKQKTKINMKYPVIYVEWQDSGLIQGRWQFIEDLGDQECHQMHSVGFLLKETKKEIVLLPNLGSIDTDMEQFAGGIIIPKSCITKRKNLQ